MLHAVLGVGGLSRGVRPARGLLCRKGVWGCKMGRNGS